MNRDPPPPTAVAAVDPNIAQEQDAAKASRIKALQDSLSSDNFNLLRLFGQSQASQTAGISAPFSTAAGGFATPFLSQNGSAPALTRAAPKVG